MFTGIVEEVGIVKSLQSGRLTVSATEVLKGTKLGDSIAINGACLTVTNIGPNSFSVDIMSETMRRTSLGALRPGQGVNLERSLAADGRFGGHFVQGHVDGTGKIISMVPEGEALLMEVAAPPDIMRYLVEKGYIAVDGVSLTINEVSAYMFEVNIIPHTAEETIIGDYSVGTAVNIEVDLLARYIERLLTCDGDAEDGAGISRDFLKAHGYA